MEDLTAKVVRIEERVSANTDDISRLRDESRETQKELKAGIESLREDNKALYEVVSTVKIMADKIATLNDNMKSGFENVSKNVNNLSGRVDAVERAPGNEARDNISKAKAVAISTVVSFLVGGALTALISFASNAIK